MALRKNKLGSQMYPWVSAMHTHLGGECSHKCKYCYVENPKTGRAPRYSGPIHLIEEEFRVNYGSDDQIIFIEHMNDLWAEEVPSETIKRVLAHCCTWPNNTYVFQTKNPGRYGSFYFPDAPVLNATFFPPNCILGVTIETNRIIEGISKAPVPEERYKAFMNVCTNVFGSKVKKFVTIEPVLAFDVDILARWIADIKPDFLNLGADSKSHNLPEPTVKDVMALVDKLHELGVDLREKHNLNRLKQE
jgi:DNA repair photolyase